MRKRVSKTKHARERARERYGIHVSKKGMREVVLRIRSGQYRSRRADEHVPNREHYTLYFRGKLISVVYDWKEKRVVTFLPR